MLGLALYMLVHNGHVIATTVRRYAGDHFVHDDADTVDVSGDIHFLTKNLLGRHVFWRTDNVTGFC